MRVALLNVRSRGDAEVLRLLLSDPRVNRSIGQLWVTEAHTRGHTEVVKMLIEAMDENTKWLEVCLSRASVNGSVEIVGILLSKYRTRELNYNSAYIRACRHGHQAIVTLLLDLLGSDKIGPLVIRRGFLRACDMGHINLTKHLLSEGHVTYQSERLALRAAHRKNNIEVISHGSFTQELSSSCVHSLLAD